MSLHSSHLKYIALITMIIDHTAIVFRNYLPDNSYLLMRSLGRTAFPLYAFLLVEGFSHTRNQWRYLLRLSLFALISEIPFDLALEGTWYYARNNWTSCMNWAHQNVFLTLAIAFAAMMVMERYSYNPVISMATFVIPAYVAEFIHTDYGAIGVLCILLFYLYRRKSTEEGAKSGFSDILLPLIPLICYSLAWKPEFFCILALPFILLYDGEKGRGPKYIFYAAYPGHMILLLFLRSLLVSVQ